MKAIQDKFIYKQEQLEKQKAKEKKANREEAEVRCIEDKHRCDREGASKDIQAIPKMIASENVMTVS